MRVSHILETVLYADDLQAAEQFYSNVLGLQVVSQFGDAVAFGCGHAVLLIFDPELSNSEGRSVPPHGCTGEGHVAFSVAGHELGAWREHLAESGIEIESEVDWGDRGRSLYFRDPAGNLVELAPPTLWQRNSASG